jgi:hypothetical protein
MDHLPTPVNCAAPQRNSYASDRFVRVQLACGTASLIQDSPIPKYLRPNSNSERAKIRLNLNALGLKTVQ